jgi:hypothetical protein
MTLTQILAWDANTALGIHGPLHDLSVTSIYFLTKLNGEGNTTTFDPIRKY